MAFGIAICYRSGSVDLHPRFVLSFRFIVPPSETSYPSSKEPEEKGKQIRRSRRTTNEGKYKKKTNRFCCDGVFKKLKICVQVKEKNKQEDKPPFFDFSSLKSRTIQTIMVSSASIATGIYTPLIYLVSRVSICVFASPLPINCSLHLKVFNYN